MFCRGKIQVFKENRVQLSLLSGTKSFFHSLARGVLYGLNVSGTKVPSSVLIPIRRLRNPRSPFLTF